MPHHHTGSSCVPCKAMDKLRSEQDRLSIWLSSDPDYIFDQCGDILTMNECKEVQKQTNATEKMAKLLKIIIDKGGNTCQSFLDILRQNQGRYQQLQQFFNSPIHSSTTPTVFADKNSAVTCRKFTSSTAKSVSMKIETVRDPGRSPPGNAGVSQADYTATGGSIICADQFSGVNIDGDINLSVSVKPSQAHAGAMEDTEQPPQGPDGKTIIKHKVELIGCLMVDPIIVQHVCAKSIVTHKQYLGLKVLPPEEAITKLIDQVIGKGEVTCAQFLEVLKKPEVLETYPQLKDILNIDAEQ
ncbi:uncharacterized protein PAE49_013832 [Odontesthes bonariensis]|uniref:uncharacterized protein LOC142396086 n=1 Tax=Odontesthes bonariensis TaxID=219752 RepID=UPI003F58E51A